MKLPEPLQQSDFAEWNEVVRGMVELWELAHQLGVEQQLEARLAADRSGVLSRQLGELGRSGVGCSVLGGGSGER